MVINSGSKEARVDDSFFFLYSFVGNIHPFPKCCFKFFLFYKKLFLIADAHMTTPSPIKNFGIDKSSIVDQEYVFCEGNCI